MCASRAKKRVTKGLRLSLECSTNAEQKRELKLPGDYEAVHETRGLERRETKNKGGIANETRNQCARKWTGSRQNYITVAKSGHSIAFGPTPIGKAIQEQAVSTLAPEPWFVTKISHSTDLAEFRGSFGKESR
jgi:hypothetical protein